MFNPRLLKTWLDIVVPGDITDCKIFLGESTTQGFITS